jgi:hypothetical protein
VIANQLLQGVGESALRPSAVGDRGR